MGKGAGEGVPKKMSKQAGNGGWSLPERERGREGAQEERGGRMKARSRVRGLRWLMFKNGR